MIVSLGQMYGDVLYYATYLFDLYHLDLNYGRPEAYYFWVYFVMINFIWMVIPGGKCPGKRCPSVRPWDANVIHASVAIQQRDCECPGFPSSGQDGRYAPRQRGGEEKPLRVAKWVLRKGGAGLALR